MELRHLIAGITVFLVLAGCTGTQDEQLKQKQSLEDENEYFSVVIPEIASNKYVRRDGSTAYATFKAPTTTYVPSDYFVEIFSPKTLDESCSPSLTGVSQSASVPITNEKVEWGKVDFFDIYGMDYDPESEPKCRPLSDGAAYALCSEKDGKRVLICISQVTDNPELAEEIFSTFRWTE